ncbi:MauE/DoxX family redox-associated membrane protein [Catelliglobosispora koreensis]|uniref:MauE/DoxX family redox-associated membrane protein n=1 Tax=Catelliglobosispora koreensis TaxID=129052 RepID=UPI00035F36A7|nr:MauE/DoxX family redox-associated membrane protein [Catelliglobosispora koreensis]
MLQLDVICRCLLATVFVVSAASKVSGSGEFVTALRAMTGVSGRLSVAMAAAVVLAEAAAVVLLLVPATAIAGLLLTAGLLVAFSLAILRALGKGNTASCQCFGASTSPLSRRHLWRNGVLLAVAVVAQASGPSQPGAQQFAIALITAALPALLVIRLDELADLLFRSAKR